MALIFDTDISTTDMLYAFNNNVIKFKSNTAAITPVKATIVTNGNTYTIYPDPNGWFWFNFKSLKSIELNASNFAETINPNISTSVPYNWTSQAYLAETISITITMSNSTTEVATRSVQWLNGYANLIDYKQKFPALKLTSTKFLLKPLPLFKYWAGLPFDIAFYNAATTDFNLKNNNSGINWTFTTGYKVPRVFFSDGRTDVSIEDFVPFNDGFNSVTMAGLDFQLEKINSYCNGHYLKWMNSFGGWNYWLFYKGNETLNTKETGVLNNDFDNLDNTISPYLSLGTESSNTIQLFQDNITPDEMELLRDLLDSVKVYLFTGLPFTKSNITDWIEVSVKGGNFRLSNSREKLNNLSLNIDLPMNVNRKL